MHSSDSILIKAPLVNVFSVASDLKSWSTFLPHYRENRFLSPMPWGGIVKMSCVRSGLKLSWVSIYRIDTERQEIQFEHLKPLTRGMKVVWKFEETTQGVKVTITHDFKLKWPLIGELIATVFVGWFLVGGVAPKTLRGLKQRLETVKS
jgi:ribosome-associated toxin RatA of RatAB toxin-antitoxin module